MRLHELEGALTGELGYPVAVSVAREPLALPALTQGERHLCEKLLSPIRREAWLRGRAALKALLERLGKDADTSRLSFPNPEISLTHTREVAIAASVRGPKLSGIGIDFEPLRPVKPEMARFFLNEAERRFLAGIPEAEKPEHLLRLWTAKEALFKSDPYNQGRGLLSYEIHDPLGWRGSASAKNGKRVSLHYVTLRLEEGFFSLAVIEPQEGRHAG